MFDNIVANNNINFNDLEKKVYKFVCELGCNIIKEIIEKYDRQLQDERDKKELRHRGLKPDSLKTVMGVVEFKKTIYEYDEDNEKKYKYLLDEKLKLSEFGKISENLVERILNIVVETNSYRDASETIMQTLNIGISHETVRDIVIKSGMKIIEREKEEIELKKDEKLMAGTKEIPVLFEEADGLWINLQGKDRKEQIENYKEQCKKDGKEYKEPSSVKSELKLHVSYEGWQKDDKRHTLVNKMYIAGFMSSEELKKRRDVQLYKVYDMEKIKLIILNGDGASWICQLATQKTIQQKDNYHIHQEIIRDIQEDEYRRQIERLIAETRYDEIPIYLEYLKHELRR